jgi:hypothetical protein
MTSCYRMAQEELLVEGHVAKIASPEDLHIIRKCQAAQPFQTQMLAILF